MCSETNKQKKTFGVFASFSAHPKIPHWSVSSHHWGQSQNPRPALSVCSHQPSVCWQGKLKAGLSPRKIPPYWMFINQVAELRLRFYSDKKRLTCLLGNTNTAQMWAVNTVFLKECFWLGIGWFMTDTLFLFITQ